MVTIAQASVYCTSLFVKVVFLVSVSETETETEILRPPFSILLPAPKSPLLHVVHGELKEVTWAAVYLAIGAGRCVPVLFLINEHGSDCTCVHLIASH